MVDAPLGGLINVLTGGGFGEVWRSSPLFADLRSPQTGGACTKCANVDACRGGCIAAKFFTGLPLDGPDPECVKGHGQTALSVVDRSGLPKASRDHSRSSRRRVGLGMPSVPAKPCDSSPLASQS